MRKNRFFLLLLFLVLVNFMGSCSRFESEEIKFPVFGETESILDRRVHLEPQLITEIPQVPRWCDLLPLKKRMVDIGDVRLYVEEEGEGVPLVLLHGGPGATHHYFHPWFSLAKKFARLIYYDQRGCGLSEFKPGPEGYSVFQAVDDLEALRKALGIDKWVVLGHSYGGFLAQFYTLVYPEHVAGLIFVGSSLGMPVDTGRSRQLDYLSSEEKKRLGEIRIELRKYFQQHQLSYRKKLQLLVYNDFLNGDWKRQNFYRPDEEQMARIALYEWDHDQNFNAIMNRSMNQIDLTGLFEKNPIPTLIFEGKYDLTWGEKKPSLLKKNHPQAQMIIVDHAGHNIFSEAPREFFRHLREFLTNLPEVSPQALATFKQTLPDWAELRRVRQVHEFGDSFLADQNWGYCSSQVIVKAYKRERLGQLRENRSYLRIGFALYDLKKYQEAHYVFTQLEEKAHRQGDLLSEVIALIWQGHMQDLLGNRAEALRCYQKVLKIDCPFKVMHAQYGLHYLPAEYARQRLKSPFQRVENQLED